MNRPVNNKWILVVDDDEATRDLSRIILKEAGYEVYLAEEGDDAVECYKVAQNCGYPFDAVIVDLFMPRGMGGRETVGKLLELDPAVRAIVTSGSIYDPAIIDFKRYGFRGALPKPFSHEHLVQTVGNVLAD